MSDKPQFYWRPGSELEKTIYLPIWCEPDIFSWMVYRMAICRHCKRIIADSGSAQSCPNHPNRERPTLTKD